jgi:hypothetical protein
MVKTAAQKAARAAKRAIASSSVPCSSKASSVPPETKAPSPAQVPLVEPAFVKKPPPCTTPPFKAPPPAKVSVSSDSSGPPAKQAGQEKEKGKGKGKKATASESAAWKEVQNQSYRKFTWDLRWYNYPATRPCDGDGKLIIPNMVGVCCVLQWSELLGHQKKKLCDLQHDHELTGCTVKRMDTWDPHVFLYSVKGEKSFVQATANYVAEVLQADIGKEMSICGVSYAQWKTDQWATLPKGYLAACRLEKEAWIVVA